MRVVIQGPQAPLSHRLQKDGQKQALYWFPLQSGEIAILPAHFLGGDVDTVSCLIEAAADVNEQFRPPYRNTWWFILNMLHARHYLSPSALTNLAYHHRGATPLMFSILTGRFEIMSVLVKAGADLNC